MSRFIITDLAIDGLKLIERQRLGDNRGFLSRIFCSDDLARAGWRMPIAQINHTCTNRRGTVRGLHYQKPPYREMKLVSCIRGEVWDVAVDLRPDSPTYLQWHAESISAENNRALLIPEGCAHGFQALSDDVELLYCHSAAYCSSAETGVNVCDPKLSIKWPISSACLSNRDAEFPMIDTRHEASRP
jgi:dTDP-4-dehydrorhamnose 3,5-epimerase